MAVLPAYPQSTIHISHRLAHYYNLLTALASATFRFLNMSDSLEWFVIVCEDWFIPSYLSCIFLHCMWLIYARFHFIGLDYVFIVPAVVISIQLETKGTCTMSLFVTTEIWTNLAGNSRKNRPKPKRAQVRSKQFARVAVSELPFKTNNKYTNWKQATHKEHACFGKSLRTVQFIQLGSSDMAEKKYRRKGQKKWFIFILQEYSSDSAGYHQFCFSLSYCCCVSQIAKWERDYDENAASKKRICYLLLSAFMMLYGWHSETG